MRATIVALVWGLGACSMQNPLFELNTAADASTLQSSSEGGPVTTEGGPVVTTGGPTVGTTEDSTADATSPVDTSEASTAGHETGPTLDQGVALQCGDMIVDPGEACDDGNDQPADGCEANCRAMFRVVEEPIGAGPRDIVAADFDGDGYPDLAVGHDGADPADAELTVLLNGFGQVLSPTDFDDPGHPGVQQVLVGAFIGDPQPDLVLVPVSGSKLRVFENLSLPGLIVFAPPVSAQGPVVGEDATAADLDGDGSDDLLMLGGGKLHVYRNAGGVFVNTFSETTLLALPVGVATGAVMAGDKSMHVAVVHAGPNSDDLSAYINAGEGKLTEGKFSSKRCPAGAATVEAGDADGVGPMDLVIACLTGHVTVVGIDEKPYQLSIGGLPSLQGAGLIDLYGDDAEADIYALSGADNHLIVGVRQGPQFVGAQAVELTDAPGAAAVADLDQDGAPDLAVVYTASAGLGLLINQTRLPPP